MDRQSLSQQLRDLAELHERGAIDADEFRSAKARLLGDGHLPSTQDEMPRAPAGVDQPSRGLGNGSPRTRASFTGLWLALGAIVLIVITVVGFVLVTSAAPGIAGKDPCTVLDRTGQDALFLANSGTAGGAPGKRQCSWENAADDSDTRVVFAERQAIPAPPSYISLLELFDVGYKIEASLIESDGQLAVAERSARTLQIRDAAEGTTGCVVAVAAGDGVVAVLDDDNAGDDVPVPVLCQHAQSVASAIMSSLDG